MDGIDKHTTIWHVLRVKKSRWQILEAAHDQRAHVFTHPHLQRKHQGIKHPVEDFLWEYYFLKPAHLHRWHPGVGVVLEDSADHPRAGWKFYATQGDDVVVDTEQFLTERGHTLAHVRELLEATLARPGRFGCFGLHEWAMVYRQKPDEVRHQNVPLRMSNTDIDEVVESHTIACTHIDAFRFFTPEAQPLNTYQPSRATQIADEQPGCLHAGMDVYKWASKLGPIIPGEVLLDAFELARDIREVDMRASPYDVSAYRGANGQFLTPIPIETNEGKRTYVAFQRQFTQRGNALRQRILDILAHPDLSGAHPVEGSPSNPTPHDEHAHAGHGGNPEDNP